MPASCCCRAPPSPLLLILSLGGKRAAWTGPQSLALFAATVILGALFLRNQKRSPEPIVTAALSPGPRHTAVLATIFSSSGAISALAVLAPIYFRCAGNVRERCRVSDDPARAGQCLDGEYSRPEYAQDRPLQAPAALTAMPVAIVVLAIVAFYADRLSAPAAAVALMVVGLASADLSLFHGGRSKRPRRVNQLGAVSGGRRLSRATGRRHRVAAASALCWVSPPAHSPRPDKSRASRPGARGPSPEARAGVARAFGFMFGAVAVALAARAFRLARVEDRPLGERSPLATNRWE